MATRRHSLYIQLSSPFSHAIILNFRPAQSRLPLQMDIVRHPESPDPNRLRIEWDPAAAAGLVRQRPYSDAWYAECLFQ